MEKSELKRRNQQAASYAQSARNIFIFDQNKCVGCGACAVACINENGFQVNDQWRKISNSNPQHFPGIPLFYLSLACNHCDDAPCMKNCPALAYSRDENTGAIIHHADKCIGCKYCTWACPYDAPKYNPNQGVVEKCTFCNHRISEGEKPACAQLCPTGALNFNYELLSREASVQSSPVKVDVGAGLKSIDLRNANGPEIDSSLFEDVPEINSTKYLSKIDARKEWPLLVFTLLATVLVAIKVLATEFTETINPYVLIGSGAVAALLSTPHLGRKERAWRALFNQKSSWLSREILSFTVFFCLLFLDTFIVDIHWLAFAISGLFLLFSIDKLYELAMWQWPTKIHSAQTLLLVASLITLFAASPILFLMVAALRISLFVFRGVTRKRKLKFYRVLRVLLFMLVSFALFYEINLWLLFTILMLGELIDRIEFYNELEVPIPENQIQL